MESKDFETQLAKTSEAKNSSEADLLSLPNVCGVGIGYKEVKGKTTKDLAVNIFVEKKVDKKQLDKKDIAPAKITIPETGEDVVTDVIEIGIIKALAYTARIRPAKPGYSIGHFKVTAGTFGCLVRETCNP